MINKGQLLLFIVLCLCSSCELAKVGEPIIVPDVEDEFYIDWRENLSETQRTLNLDIRTIKEEQCPDASITYNFSRFNLGYRISLNDIASADNCTAKEYPALVDIPMGYVGRGTYQIEIDLKSSVSNEGVLQSNMDSYSLNMRSEDGIQIVNKVLYKIPENTIWGYFSFEKTEDEQVVDQLLTEIANISTPQEFKAGYYGHFRIGSTGQIALVNQPISSRLKTFIFSVSDKRTELTQFADKVKSTHGEEIILSMYDDKGWQY